LQIPLKKEIEGEREGDFTDNFIVQIIEPLHYGFIEPFFFVYGEGLLSSIEHIPQQRMCWNIGVYPFSSTNLGFCKRECLMQLAFFLSVRFVREKVGGGGGGGGGGRFYFKWETLFHASTIFPFG
jgi:hypothetical protein